MHSGNMFSKEQIASWIGSLALGGQHPCTVLERPPRARSNNLGYVCTLGIGWGRSTWASMPFTCIAVMYNTINAPLNVSMPGIPIVTR